MTRKGRERSGEESVGPYYLRTPFTEQRYMHAKFWLLCVRFSDYWGFFLNLVDAIKLLKDYKVAWNQVPLWGKMAKTTTWLASFADCFWLFSQLRSLVPSQLWSEHNYNILNNITYQTKGNGPNGWESYFDHKSFIFSK